MKKKEKNLNYKLFYHKEPETLQSTYKIDKHRIRTGVKTMTFIKCYDYRKPLKPQKLQFSSDKNKNEIEEDVYILLRKERIACRLPVNLLEKKAIKIKVFHKKQNSSNPQELNNINGQVLNNVNVKFVLCILWIYSNLLLTWYSTENANVQKFPDTGTQWLLVILWIFCSPLLTWYLM